MIGSILTVKQMLQKTPALEIGYIRASNSKHINTFNFPEDRSFVIPGYQREFRWNTNNIQVLIEDLSDRPKFLGYVLLSTSDDKIFHIIDGQQRITVFYMILEAIFRRDASSRIEICDFNNESFGNMKDSIANDFYANNDELRKQCQASDDLKQYDSFVALFNYTKSLIEEMSDKRFHDFKSHLLESDISLIIQPIKDKDSEKKVCVDYFIDVNNKSVKLDYIDILKAYAFKEEFEIIVPKWKRVLKDNKSVDFAEYHYPVETMFLHYTLCSINSIVNYGVKAITDDFKISKPTKVNEKLYEAGTDVEELIGSTPFYGKMLDTISDFIEFEKIIVNDKFSYGKDFDKYINPVDKDANDQFKQNAFDIIGAIIRSSDVVPKLLLMKYFIDVVSNENATYDQYKLIYYIGILSTFFTASQGDAKKRSEFSTLVLSKKWDKILVSKSEQRIRKQPLPIVFNKVVKQCGSYNKTSGQYLARRVHAILASITDKEIVSFHPDTFRKFNGITLYNDEHFIINQSYGITFEHNKKTVKYEYPENIRPYVSHLSNYIFILDDLNTKLGNKTIKDKINIIDSYLKSHKNSFKDKLSELKYKSAKKAFGKGKCPTESMLESSGSVDEAKKLLDAYFQESFLDEYNKYVQLLKNDLAKLSINELSMKR